jgi:Lrp/AsnC family transcriptional regulator
MKISDQDRRLLSAVQSDATLSLAALSERLSMVTLEDHSEKAVAGFTALVSAQPEILECHKVSGASDYSLKIRAADVEAYEVFQTRYLLRSPWVRSVQSSFVLKEVKSTTELPL